MAKKFSSKEKKAVRMAETERLNVLKVQLQALSAANDLLADLPAFVSYHCRGLTARLAFYRSADLPPLLLDWALALTERHMRPMYEAAPGWGWSIAKKHAELAHEDARFVVVTAAEAAEQLLPSVAAAGAAEEAVAAVATLAAEQQQLQHIASGQPLAFMHFRFEEEEGDAVAYLYEIQVEAAAQGRGLGAHLIRVLELLAFRAGLPRVMLTVFHENAGALALYRKLGYVTDESSPEVHDPDGDYAYTILSKRRKA